jgi:hypothetical protein
MTPEEVLNCSLNYEEKIYIMQINEDKFNNYFEREGIGVRPNPETKYEELKARLQVFDYETFQEMIDEGEFNQQ